VSRRPIGAQRVATKDERRIARKGAHIDLASAWQPAPLQPLEGSWNPPAMRALADEGRALRRRDVKTALAHETPRADVIAMAVR
jgi:hypothetical protein